MSDIAEKFNPHGLDYPESREELEKALSAILADRKQEKHPDDPTADVSIKIVSYDVDTGETTLMREKACGSCLSGIFTQRMVGGGLSGIWPDIDVSWDTPVEQRTDPTSRPT